MGLEAQPVAGPAEHAHVMFKQQLRYILLSMLMWNMLFRHPQAGAAEHAHVMVNSSHAITLPHYADIMNHVLSWYMMFDSTVHECEDIFLTIAWPHSHMLLALLCLSACMTSRVTK